VRPANQSLCRAASDHLGHLCQTRRLHSIGKMSMESVLESLHLIAGNGGNCSSSPGMSGTLRRVTGHTLYRDFSRDVLISSQTWMGGEFITTTADVVCREHLTALISPSHSCFPNKRFTV
jgi:hypothetical protein